MQSLLRLRPALLISAVVAAALLVLSASAAHASPAPASVQVVTIVNAAHVNPHRLRHVERVIARQVDAAREWWPTIPSIRFGAGGWTVELLRPADAAPLLGLYAGSHGFDRTPNAVVSAGTGWDGYLDHELLEMLADPQGTGPEICDPVEGHYYMSHGVWLSDFVLPSFFTNPHFGRLDYLDKLRSRELVAE